MGTARCLRRAQCVGAQLWQTYRKVGEGTLECSRLLNFEIARLYRKFLVASLPLPFIRACGAASFNCSYRHTPRFVEREGGAGHQPAPRRDQPQAHQVRPPSISSRDTLPLLDWKHTHRLRGDRRPTECVRVSNKRSLHASVVFACRCTARKHYTCIIATNATALLTT